MNLKILTKNDRQKRRKWSKMAINDITGVYFGKDRFLHVINQPRGNPGYISNISNTATNFRRAGMQGIIGLIAHNYLGGRIFHDLHVGDDVYIMDGFCNRKKYRIYELLQFQAIDPRSMRSDFINLDNKEICSATDLFNRVYTGRHRLVLQTCIKKGNNHEWGRRFLIAYPA